MAIRNRAMRPILSSPLCPQYNFFAPVLNLLLYILHHAV
jgi:hypothetical protein